MKCLLFLYCLGFVLVQTCRCANIVVFMPQPFHSHLTAFKPLWLELAKRGHKLTLIQPNIIVENNENITHILLDKTHDIMDKHGIFDKMGKDQFILKLLLSAVNGFNEILEYQLTHPEVQELLKGEKKVDLFFTEYLAPFGFFLGHKLNAPMIAVVSMDALTHSHIAMGNPTHPVMYPDKNLKYVPPLSFMERVESTLFRVLFEVVANYVITPLSRIAVKPYLGEIPPPEEIVKNISLLFTNSNPLFSVVRPLGPKTINIGGGIHMLEPQPLPKDLQDHLDNAKSGVIYFSLGSNINSNQLPNRTREVFVETFSQLRYQVLWKFDIAIPNSSDNVKVVEWVPQQDLLRHKNVKLFITQGGLQSLEEGTFSHVPMLGLPFYGDQHSNTRKMVAMGFGLTLDYRELDVKTFKGAILDILNNPRYKERTKEVADHVMDQPMTGLEKAVWWTEYVLRHGHTDHFRDPSVDTPWYQFLLLDVISFLVVAATVLIYALVKTFQLLKWLLRLVRKLCRLQTNKKTKTKTS